MTGRVRAMADGVRAIAALRDPVGEVLEGFRLPNGLDVDKVRVPLGVVAVVYEARPNVTIDATALALKSGNAIVLRGSSTAAHSNAVLAAIAGEAATAAGLPDGAVTLIAGGGREELAELATQDGVVDLVIPRGGEGLKAALSAVATVPVIYAASGNCHVVVDAGADLDAARRIILNAKTQRPGVCNAAETLLVHADVAAEFLPGALRELHEAGVELRVDGRARAAAGEALAPVLRDAVDEDWDTEYLALVLAVGVVDSRGRGHRARQRPRLRPLRGDRHARRGQRPRLRAPRRRRRRLRQRLDALHRRRRVRHGGRDRQLDPEAARARADRHARAVHDEVRRPRRRPGPGVATRLGLLGGTFNPPHLGHLVMAQEAHEQLGLDRVLLVPVAVPPHKEAEADPGAEARVRLSELAVGDDDRFGVSRIEVDRGGPSFTVDTLRALHDRAPEDDLTFIVGGDMAHSLPSWREPEAVLELATLAVAEREGVRREDLARRLEPLHGGDRVTFFDMPRLDVSSSAIRRRVAAGRSIRYLVPDAVARAVTDGGLYRPAVGRPAA